MNHVAVLESSMLGEELKTDKQRVIRTLRNLTTYKSFRVTKSELRQRKYLGTIAYVISPNTTHALGQLPTVV